MSVPEYWTLYLAMLAAANIVATASFVMSIRNRRRSVRVITELRHSLAFARAQARTAEKAAVEAQQQAQRALQARVASLNHGEFLYISPADRDACERMASRVRSRLVDEAPADRFRHLFHHYADGLCRTASGTATSPIGRFPDGLGMFVCSRPAGHLGRRHWDIRAGQLRGWWSA